MKPQSLFWKNKTPKHHLQLAEKVGGWCNEFNG